MSMFSSMNSTAVGGSDGVAFFVAALICGIVLAVLLAVGIPALYRRIRHGRPKLTPEEKAKREAEVLAQHEAYRAQLQAMHDERQAHAKKGGYGPMGTYGLPYSEFTHVIVEEREREAREAAAAEAAMQEQWAEAQSNWEELQEDAQLRAAGDE